MKIVVLPTDGYRNQNTVNNDANASYYSGDGYSWQNRVAGLNTSNQNNRDAALDARMTTLCNNMKAQNVIIYTVRIDVSGTAAGPAAEEPAPPIRTDFFDVPNVPDLPARVRQHRRGHRPTAHHALTAELSSRQIVRLPGQLIVDRIGDTGWRASRLAGRNARDLGELCHERSLYRCSQDVRPWYAARTPEPVFGDRHRRRVRNREQPLPTRLSLNSHTASPQVAVSALKAGIARAIAAAEAWPTPYPHRILATTCWTLKPRGWTPRFLLTALDLGGVSGARELHNETRCYFDQATSRPFPTAGQIADAFQDA